MARGDLPVATTLSAATPRTASAGMPVYAQAFSRPHAQRGVVLLVNKQNAVGLVHFAAVVPAGAQCTVYVVDESNLLSPPRSSDCTHAVAQQVLLQPFAVAVVELVL
jgi:hypothetical protein